MAWCRKADDRSSLAFPPSHGSHDGELRELMFDGTCHKGSFTRILGICMCACTYGRVAAHDADHGLVIAQQRDCVLVRPLTRVPRLGVDRDLIRHDACPHGHSLRSSEQADTPESFVRRNLTAVLESGTVVVGDVGDDAVVAALPPGGTDAAGVIVWRAVRRAGARR